MIDAREVAERYIATWNTPDAECRRRLIDSHWAADPRYTDPLMSAAGGAELSTMIDAVQNRFQGFRFTLLGRPDGHGTWVRFSWGLGPDGGEPVIEGSDIVQLEGHLIKQVVGFLDKVPATA
eukprot:gene37697-50891_t